MNKELDDFTGRFFSAFDNRGDRRPDFTALQAMFVPGAVIFKRNGDSMETCSVASFIEPRAALLTDGSLTEFHEWETESETVSSGGFATRICRYGKQGVLRGRTYAGTGVKFIHFLRMTAGWKISSILWEDADDGAVPPDFRRSGCIHVPREAPAC